MREPLPRLCTSPRETQIKMNNKLAIFHTLMKEHGNPPRDAATRPATLGVQAASEEDVVLDIENDNPKPEGFDSDDLESFYTLISKVKLNCYKLRQKTKEQRSSAENLGEMVATADKLKQANEEYVRINEEAASIIRETKEYFDRIKEMCHPETGLKALRGIDTSDDNLDEYAQLKFDKPEYRMVVSAKMAAGKNWADAVQQYTECERDIAKDFREMHRRQYALLNDGKEPDEAYLDEHEGEHVDVFGQAMSAEMEAQQISSKRMATQSYFEARSKEEAVNEILEMQIENHELWASLGIAIQHHGQLLDNIYANVEKAQAYVKEGNENLLVVQARKESSNKCRCFVLLGLTVIAAAIIVPTVMAS